MATEIERKFLIKTKEWNALKKPKAMYCLQAYVAFQDLKVVRARVIDDKGFLTIKGKTNGISRLEFEYEIPKKEATEMIEKLGNGSIEKDRFIIPQGDLNWEVDVFYGDNEGLIVAEIELPNENTSFELPNWIGEEVSDQPKYYNVNLLKSPFKNWVK